MVHGNRRYAESTFVLIELEIVCDRVKLGGGQLNSGISK